MASSRPSNCRYMRSQPASFSFWAYPGTFASFIPLVFTCRCTTPIALPSRIISGRSSRTVGSPPESCTLQKGFECSAAAYISRIRSMSGSNCSAFASAKHTAQFMLQR